MHNLQAELDRQERSNINSLIIQITMVNSRLSKCSIIINNIRRLITNIIHIIRLLIVINNNTGLVRAKLFSYEMKSIKEESNYHFFFFRLRKYIFFSSIFFFLYI